MGNELEGVRKKLVMEAEQVQATRAEMEGVRKKLGAEETALADAAHAAAGAEKHAQLLRELHGVDDQRARDKAERKQLLDKLAAAERRAETAEKRAERTREMLDAERKKCKKFTMRMRRAAERKKTTAENESTTPPPSPLAEGGGRAKQAVAERSWQ